jgi:putative DNA modification/repair radical SAM protein
MPILNSKIDFAYCTNIVHLYKFVQMNWERVSEKLSVLSDAAKYDVSCSSSGSKRQNKDKGLGNASNGICHSYSEDGRCISLLKILLTNFCIYDCAYCVSRRSNDIKRVAFTVEEVVDLTINFYRRNYIEGLFLSSGIFKNPDYTMERLVRVAKTLRLEHNYNGYIHLKTIPGASDDLMREAGLYADRLSVNIEMPSEQSLKMLAPEKNEADIVRPMSFLSQTIKGLKEERALIKSAPAFAPAGQSTQMVIGASPETDKDIMFKADSLYRNFSLKRVYYSGYVPISNDERLPALRSPVPFVREHRLYQADWLMRFYKFKVDEIVTDADPILPTDIDPKLNWALRNLHLFPLDINKADYEMIMRVPGIGLSSAMKIVQARRFGMLGWEQLKKIGISINRAKYFITCKAAQFIYLGLNHTTIRQRILQQAHSKYETYNTTQLALF